MSLLESLISSPAPKSLLSPFSDSNIELPEGLDLENGDFLSLIVESLKSQGKGDLAELIASKANLKDMDLSKLNLDFLNKSDLSSLDLGDLLAENLSDLKLPDGAELSKFTATSLKAEFSMEENIKLPIEKEILNALPKDLKNSLMKEFKTSKKVSLEVLLVRVEYKVQNTKTSAMDDLKSFVKKFLDENSLISKNDKQNDVELKIQDLVDAVLKELFKAPTLSELPEDLQKTQLSEATFLQVLQVLEHLNNGEKPKLPVMNDRLKNLLANEEIKTEFKNVKSLDELIKLSKKYELGLEKLKITHEDAKELKQIFPKLAEKKFFDMPKLSMPTQNFLQTKPAKLVHSQELIKEQVFKNDIKKKTTKISFKSESVEINITKNDNKQSALSALLGEKFDLKSKITNADKIEKLDLNIKNSENKNSQGLLQALMSKNNSENTANNTLNKLNETFQNVLNENSTKSEESKQNEQTKEINEINGDEKMHVQSKINSKFDPNLKNLNLKHTLNTFAQEFKEKVESYKPPIMRVTMSLNPNDLGSVDVTIISRGKDLHVNFNSNTTTMNLFMQNQTEFKSSLVNMGFSNLEMNFSNQKENQKDDNKQNNKNNNKQTNDDDEEFQDLDIILPNFIK